MRGGPKVGDARQMSSCPILIEHGSKLNFWMRTFGAPGLDLRPLRAGQRPMREGEKPSSVVDAGHFGPTFGPIIFFRHYNLIKKNYYNAKKA